MTEVSSPPEYARTMRLGLDIVERASQQRQDDRLLGVEPALRLVEGDRVRAVEHRVGDLLAPMGGQAVHDQHRGLREAHDRLVDLVAAERLLTPRSLRLLSHARPHVGVDHVGPGRGLPRVLGDLDPAAEPTRRVPDPGGRLVAGRARDDGRGAEQRAQEDHGVAHVVTVADPCEPHRADVDAPLPQREEVGERLTRVLGVGEPVDYGDGRVAGERLDRRVRVDARGDTVYPAREVPRHVRNRLARAQADLRAREVNGAPAELDDPDLEGDAGPEGRLLEDQRHRAAGERRAAPSRLPALLEVRGELEYLERRVARQVRRREKVAHHALGRSAVSTISSARSQWSSSMIRGGTRRSTFSPADRTRSPAFRQASRMGLTGRSSSTPMSRPRPRTSRIPTGPCANRLRPSMRRRPIRAARSGIFSPSTVWSVASATEVTNGVPPNVEPCVPGPSARATSSRVSMAPIGTPLASALARVMTSGSIPECSYAQSVPVRPTPVWTSSRIRRAPDASQSLRSPGR